MIFFRIFNVVAVSVMFTTGLSTTHRDVKKSFTLHQKPKSYFKSGPAHILSAYQRLDARAPEDLKTAVAINKGTVNASPSKFDSAFLVPITIGGQTFDVFIDTGSHLLWVYSPKLPSAGHTSYNPSLSKTSRLQQRPPWKICNGDSNVNCAAGDFYIDTVSVGGVTSENQIIGAATSVNAAVLPQAKGFDGLFGLAISLEYGNERIVNPTFFENVESSLSAPLFTADLKKGIPGSYDFGFIDESKYNGNITYVPVDRRRGHWQFDVSGYAIGNENINLVYLRVVADTGSSIIVAPDHIVKDYYAAVPGAVYNSAEFGYVFPCGTVLPDLTFVIGGYKAVVPGSYLEYCPIGRSNITCYGGIQSLGIQDAAAYIMGDVFLKSQFVVFDGTFHDPRIGFAAKSL